MIFKIEWHEMLSHWIFSWSNLPCSFAHFFHQIDYFLSIYDVNQRFIILYLFIYFRNNFNKIVNQILNFALKKHHSTRVLLVSCLRTNMVVQCDKCADVVFTVSNVSNHNECECICKFDSAVALQSMHVTICANEKWLTNVITIERTPKTDNIGNEWNW